MARDYKERWQEFFEDAEEELDHDAPFHELSEYADAKLADDEARLIDAAYEEHRHD